MAAVQYIPQLIGTSGFTPAWQFSFRPTSAVVPCSAGSIMQRQGSLHSRRTNVLPLRLQTGNYAAMSKSSHSPVRAIRLRSHTPRPQHVSCSNETHVPRTVPSESLLRTRNFEYLRVHVRMYCYIYLRLIQRHFQYLSYTAPNDELCQQKLGTHGRKM
jgi:hypothetical protein